MPCILSSHPLSAQVWQCVCTASTVGTKSGRMASFSWNGLSGICSSISFVPALALSSLIVDDCVHNRTSKLSSDRTAIPRCGTVRAQHVRCSSSVREKDLRKFSLSTLEANQLLTHRQHFGPEKDARLQVRDSGSVVDHDLVCRFLVFYLTGRRVNRGWLNRSEGTGNHTWRQTCRAKSCPSAMSTKSRGWPERERTVY
jgi:hypothetical protein